MWISTADQGLDIDNTTSPLFPSTITTNETCRTAVTNCTASAEEQTRSIAERIIWCMLLIIIILASLIGNGLVLTCVYFHHRLREENSSLFIINLSLVDMVSAAIVMVSSLHALASDKWLMGPTWCDIVCGTNYNLIIVSILTLCFVSLDRYIAVKYALHYHARVTKLKICLLLGYAWCLGFCFGLVPILYRWIRFDYWEAVCAIVWHEDRERVLLFVSVGFTICFALPSAVLIVAYSKVMKIALAHNKIHQQKADIQANMPAQVEVPARFATQRPATENRNPENRANCLPRNTDSTGIHNNKTKYLPPVSSDNKGSHDDTLRDQNSRIPHFHECQTEMTLNSNVNFTGDRGTCHHLLTSSSQSELSINKQTGEREYMHDTDRSTNHQIYESAGWVDRNGSTKSTNTDTEMIQFSKNSSDSVDNLHHFATTLTDGGSLNIVRNICLGMNNEELNAAEIRNVGDSNTKMSVSSCSETTGFCDKCNNSTKASLSISPFTDMNKQPKVPTIDNQSQLTTRPPDNQAYVTPQTAKQTPNNKWHVTTDTAKQITDNQMQSATQQMTQNLNTQMQTNAAYDGERPDSQRQAPADHDDGEITASLNVPITTERLSMPHTDNNTKKTITNTRRFSRPSTNNNNNVAFKRRSTASSNKAVKSLLLVVIAYFICMTPFCVTKLCKVVFVKDILPDYINLVASIFQYCSSAINPLIYGIFRKDFQVAFRLIAKRFLCKLDTTTTTNMSDFQSTVY